MRTKFLVFAVLAFALVLSACNMTVFSNPAPGMQPHTIEATGFESQAACEPKPDQACVVTTTKTISGGQTTSTYLIANWVGQDMPSSIEVKFNFRATKDMVLEVVPGVQKALEGGMFDEDVTIYAIIVNDYTCEFRQGTNIFDCSKN